MKDRKNKIYYERLSKETVSSFIFILDKDKILSYLLLLPSKPVFNVDISFALILDHLYVVFYYLFDLTCYFDSSRRRNNAADNNNYTHNLHQSGQIRRRSIHRERVRGIPAMRY